jgi:phosphoribosylanthranilate isomerase
MSLLVKICGVTTQEGIDAAVESGADAIGFVFHAPSSRNLQPARAAALAALLPVQLLRVAVTLHPSQALVDSVLAAFEPDVWQSDAGDFEHLRLPSQLQCWPVWRSGGALPQERPGRFLYEAPASGAGTLADWETAAALAREGELILGGGLDAHNVASAVALVRPFGVDVSTGVERAAGQKDAALIRQFIAAARAADRKKTA